MRPNVPIFWLALCGLSLLVSGCEPEPEIVEELIRPVRYQQVLPVAEGQKRVFTGTSRDTKATRMSFRIAGRVSAMNIKVGDVTKPDMVIAKLDNADLRLRVNEANAALQQAKASQRNAAAVLQRVRGLYENNNASKSDLDSARANAEAASAAVTSIRNQLALARRQVSYAEMRAPGTCDVAVVDVEVNENLAAGQPVALLGCGGQAEVKVAVPGSVINFIRQNDKVVVRFAAIPNVVFQATATEVGVAATEAGETFPVTVRIDEEPVPVRSGLSAEVEFTLHGPGEEDASRIVVPLSAVGGHLDGRFVYVLADTAGETTTVTRQQVQVGDFSSEGIEVVEGLAEGDVIVTAGVSQLRDGMTVAIRPELEDRE